MDAFYDLCRRQTAFGNGLYSKPAPHRLESAFDNWNRRHSIWTKNKGIKYLKDNCTCDEVERSEWLYTLPHKWQCTDENGQFTVYRF